MSSSLKGLISPPTTNFVLPSSFTFVSTFLPTQIPGCQLWLDAADTTTYTSSSSVTSWRNKGTAGGTCSRTNGTFNSTSFTINSVRAMALSSGATMSTPTLTFGTTSRSIFLVPNIGGTGSQYTYTGAGTLVDPQCYTWSGAPDLELNKPGLNILVTNSTTNYFNSTSIVSITSGININGTAQTLSVDRGNSLFNSGVTTTLTLGGSDTAAYNLGEIIIFDGLLTTDQRQQIEGYLGAKWGLQAKLPSNNKYISYNASSVGTSSLPFISTALGPPNSVSMALSSFNPKSISGIQLWLDAADPSTITGTSPVTAWRDKSGNGNNGTASGSPVLLANSLNGSYPSIYFNGSSSIAGATVVSGPTLTAFCILQTTDTNLSTNGRLLSLSTPGQNDYNTNLTLSAFIQFNPTYICTSRAGGGTAGTILYDVPVGTSALVATTFAGNTSNTFYGNGSLFVNQTDPNWTTNFSITTYCIGTAINPFNAWYKGRIGEIILYSTALTNPQRQQVEGYLAWKWGLQAKLPGTHAYKSFPPPP